MPSADIEALRAQLDSQEQLDDLIERMTDEIARVVPDFSRFQRVAQTELRNNPKLQQCDAISFLSALMLSAQMGLEPGDQQGLSWLIPRKIDGRLQCTWLIGYRGVRALAMRTGRYRQIVTGTVREGDRFDWRPVPDPYLEHDPAGPGERGEPVAYYAWAEPTDGNVGIPVVLEPDEVEKRRHVGGARGKPNNSPAWENWHREMAEKTCVRAMARKLELSEAVIRAAESGAVIDPGDVEDSTVQIAATSSRQQGQQADAGEAATEPSGRDSDEQEPPDGPSRDGRHCPKCDATGGTHHDTCPTMAGDEIGGRHNPLSQVVKASDTAVADVLRYAQDRARQLEVDVPQSTGDLDDLGEVLEAELRVWLTDHDGEGDDT